MPIDGKLLEILCCPVSKTPLIRVSATRLKKLNEAIAAGEALKRRIKERVGVSVEIAAHGSGGVPRSQGKAVRIIDNRPKE